MSRAIEHILAGKTLKVENVVFRYSRYSMLIAAVLCAALFAQNREALQRRVSELERRVADLELRMKRMQQGDNAPATSKPSVSAAPSRRTSAKPAKSAARKKLPIAVRLVSKELQEKGPGEKADRLGFTFLFKNVGSEHVTSFSGDILLLSASGEVLHTFPFDIATYVTAGGTTQWYSSILFRAVSTTHRTLQSSSIELITVRLKLRRVMYYDTRVENF
jgi:hypothetical protein